MNENQVKSLTKLAGLGAGIYYANKKNKSVWGFVGYAFLGMFAGSIVGGLISKTVTSPTIAPVPKK